MNYQNKYLKYKNKYLNLLEQSGGENRRFIKECQIINETIDKKLFDIESDYNTYITITVKSVSKKLKFSILNLPNQYPFQHCKIYLVKGDCENEINTNVLRDIWTPITKIIDIITNKEIYNKIPELNFILGTPIKNEIIDIDYTDNLLYKNNMIKFNKPIIEPVIDCTQNIHFIQVPFIKSNTNIDNIMYKNKYQKQNDANDILHNFIFFKESTEQNKIDAFIVIYLYTIVALHIDILYKPISNCELPEHNKEYARTINNKIRIIANTIAHIPIIQNLSIIYLGFKLINEIYIINEQKKDIKENTKFSNMDDLVDFIDDCLLYIIHIVLSYNYTEIIKYLNSKPINEIPILYETINENIELNLECILFELIELTKYTKCNLTSFLFYRFPENIYIHNIKYIIPDKYGNQLVIDGIPQYKFKTVIEEKPLDFDYYENNAVLDYRDYKEKFHIDTKFYNHTETIINNSDNPLKHFEELYTYFYKILVKY